MAIKYLDSLFVEGSLRIEDELYDSNNSSGTAGQVLSSTATGTDWVTPTTGDITGVTAGTALTGGDTSGNVTLNVSTAGVAGLSGANIPTSTANRNYVVQHQDTANQTLVVNVPVPLTLVTVPSLPATQGTSTTKV